MDSYGDTSGRIGRDWLDRHDEELEQELLDDCSAARNLARICAINDAP